MSVTDEDKRDAINLMVTSFNLQNDMNLRIATLAASAIGLSITFLSSFKLDTCLTKFSMGAMWIMFLTTMLSRYLIINLRCKKLNKDGVQTWLEGKTDSTLDDANKERILIFILKASFLIGTLAFLLLGFHTLIKQ